jgi:hypothetical protein
VSVATDQPYSVVASLTRPAWAGVILLGAALAIGVIWLAPAQGANGPFVRVDERSGQTYGEFIGVSQDQVIVRGGDGSTSLVPVPVVVSITPVANCA